MLVFISNMTNYEFVISPIWSWYREYIRGLLIMNIQTANQLRMVKWNILLKRIFHDYGICYDVYHSFFLMFYIKKRDIVCNSKRNLL